MSTITSIASSDVVKNSRAVINTNFSNLNTDKVEGQSSSVDSEIALFSGTGGKTIKRASSTGILKGESGVIGVITDSSGLASAISDETGSGSLVFATSPSITTPTITTPTIKTWDGWNTVSDSWSYASATTITVPSGAASLYSKGDKIKLTQTTVKYFYVVSVADTLLTVSGGTDYTVANAAITSPFVSHVENPVGFPTSFSYTPTFTGFSSNPGLTDPNYARFSIRGNICTVAIQMDNGTSNATSFTLTVPVTSSKVSSSIPYQAVDAGSVGTAPGYGSLAAASTTVTMYKDMSSATWTASGNKRAVNFKIAYEF